MANNDRQHFEKYTPQNQIKHEILSKYFSAYLRTLARHAKAFHYIDGFAGPGLYEGRFQGSPLLALEVLGAQGVPCSASFIERDAQLYSTLKKSVAAHAVVKTGKLFDEPFVEQGEFKDWVTSVLARPIYKKHKTTATFAFVDPCGVRGVRMRDLIALLNRPYGECLLFWNYDGINRWLGLVAKGEHGRTGLVELFGGDEPVDQALKFYGSTAPTGDKEKEILRLFMRVLKDGGKKFILPFRVEARDKDRTSHYLIHCSGHSLAFKIMKDVMSKATTSPTAGTFHFSTAAETASLFTPADDARTEVLQRLYAGPERVKLFTEEWTLRPDDFLIDKDYREILLRLESEKIIEVLDKTGRHAAPAVRRRMRDGKPTLGPDYYVRIVPPKSV